MVPELFIRKQSQTMLQGTMQLHLSDILAILEPGSYALSYKSHFGRPTTLDDKFLETSLEDNLPQRIILCEEPKCITVDYIYIHIFYHLYYFFINIIIIQAVKD